MSCIIWYLFQQIYKITLILLLDHNWLKGTQLRAHGALCQVSKSELETCTFPNLILQGEDEETVIIYLHIMVRPVPPGIVWKLACTCQHIYMWYLGKMLPNRMKIYKELNLATWLSIVNFNESNIRKFSFSNFYYVSYHWYICKKLKISGN